MATFTLKGVQDMEARLRDLTRTMRDNAQSALREEADEIVRIAKEEYVPIDTGELRDSIRVEESGTGVGQGRSETGQFTSGADISVSVVAGGPGLEHAVAVHEYPSEYNPPTWNGVEVTFKKPGSGPRFIQRPLLDRSKGLLSRVAPKIFNE